MLWSSLGANPEDPNPMQPVALSLGVRIGRLTGSFHLSPSAVFRSDRYDMIWDGKNTRSRFGFDEMDAPFGYDDMEEVDFDEICIDDDEEL